MEDSFSSRSKSQDITGRDFWIIFYIYIWGRDVSVVTVEWSEMLRLTLVSWCPVKPAEQTKSMMWTQLQVWKVDMLCEDEGLYHLQEYCGIFSMQNGRCAWPVTPPVHCENIFSSSCCCLLSETFFSHKLFAPVISRARRWHTHSHTQAHPALPPLDQCIELWNDFYWRTFAYPSRQHANDGVLIAITKYKQRWNKQSFSTLYTPTLGCCVAATCSFIPTWTQRIKKLKYRIWGEWAIHY